ncbi:hypothetical protein BBJ29_003595 [Phytophthora kernoviae]|uniref:WW domain-containing protein n=1 Tax=Phytophthora kernoviae TaxID=325452 RepID=A0A3F2RRS6_9STRA|nr:hypothetical protein BBP00_00004420 [Phytophthora kernoviae]RLN65490.1 hypothetical protein BBJ29_003595 [Phytophthora kernoviae]
MYREAQLNKKKQWKEIVRPENGEKFYYNKVTGEVRFRRPQDVLDLLLKPHCENCDPESTPNLARMECKDCGEMFCDTVRVGDELVNNSMASASDGSGEWIKYYDEAQGVHYFYNIRTQESTYSRPATYATPRISPSPAATPLVSALDGWEKHVDPQSGYPYYYNSLTMESVFARPIGFTTVREDADQIGWAKYFDASTGIYFYFNSRTNESRADRPNMFSTPRISTIEVVDAGEGGLAEFYDPVTGKAYYFNAETTECRQAEVHSTMT